jgi:hypothetical protein
MKNSDMPAMPTYQLQETCNRYGVSGPDMVQTIDKGLTKREHFAGLAMQALISATPAWMALGYPCPHYSDTVKESYEYADLMTAETGEPMVVAKDDGSYSE